MKTELQKYERQTGRMVGLSVGLIIVGATIWMLWSSYGAIIAGVGAVGLAWAFLRR
jgi:hypothetical protein